MTSEENQKKCLSAKSVVIIIAVIYIINTPIISGEEESSDSDKSLQIYHEYCDSEDCDEMQETSPNNGNQKATPCSNFYKYVCYEMKNKTLLKMFGRTDQNMESDEYQKLEKVLSEYVTADDLRAFKIAKNFYKRCMSDSIRKFVPVKKLGGWPLTGDVFNENSFNWIELATRIHDMGYTDIGLISVTIAPDLKNNSVHRINIGTTSVLKSKPEIGLGTCLFSKQFRSFMFDVTDVLFPSIKYSNYQKEMNDAVDFLIKLCNFAKSGNTQATVPNLMTINELSEKYPSIQFLEYIDKMIKPAKPITDAVIVNVLNEEYLCGLEKLLTSTPKRTLMNAMMMEVVYASLPYLNDQQIRKKYAIHVNNMRRFIYKTRPNPFPPIRRIECLLSTLNELPLATGALYIRQYVTPKEKRQVTNIANDVKQELIDLLREAVWMPEKTRETAITKLKSTSMHLSYPNELLDDDKINDYYHDLELKGVAYIIMKLSINLFNARKHFDRLEQKADRNDWVRHSSAAQISQMGYNFNDNSIDVPAGYLQNVIFDSNRPDYMNYATIGTLIGTLATHSWDNSGRYYDMNGNYADWWDKKTKVEYHKRAGCYIHQYNQMGINGINTEVGNIAHHIGFTAAYRAYQNRVKRNGTEHSATKLPYSTNQMFWIGAANMFCQKSSWLYYRHRILGNLSPIPAVVIGSLANIPEFSRDFHCQKNSEMNPETKCHIF